MYKNASFPTSSPFQFVSKLLVLCQYDWWETVYHYNYNLHFCYCQRGETFSRIFEKHCLLMNNVLLFFYWVAGHWSFLYEFIEVCCILRRLVRYSCKYEKKTEKDKNFLSNVFPQMFIAMHVKICQIYFQNILKQILCFFLPLKIREHLQCGRL